jgi:hypothetical protein
MLRRGASPVRYDAWRLVFPQRRVVAGVWKAIPVSYMSKKANLLAMVFAVINRAGSEIRFKELVDSIFFDNLKLRSISEASNLR